MVGACAFFACYKRIPTAIATAGVEVFELEALAFVGFLFVFVGTSRGCDARHGPPDSIRRHGFGLGEF